MRAEITWRTGCLSSKLQGNALTINSFVEWNIKTESDVAGVDRVHIKCKHMRVLWFFNHSFDQKLYKATDNN